MSTQTTNPNDSAHPTLGQNGLTKREYFAAAALQGMLANSYSNGSTQPLAEYPFKDLGEFAVAAADALIEALNAQTPQP